MTQTARQALREADLYTDGIDYHVLKLPPNGITVAAGIVAEAGTAFSAVIVDKDEVSLLLPAEACAAFSARLRRATVSEQVYRLISFDAVLQPTLIGFIARIAAALAQERIPILTFAAYSRDHIFVPAEDFPRALNRLRRLQAESE